MKKVSASSFSKRFDFVFHHFSYSCFRVTISLKINAIKQHNVRLLISFVQSQTNQNWMVLELSDYVLYSPYTTRIYNLCVEDAIHYYGYCGTGPCKVKRQKISCFNILLTASRFFKFLKLIYSFKLIPFMLFCWENFSSTLYTFLALNLSGNFNENSQ